MINNRLKSLKLYWAVIIIAIFFLYAITLTEFYITNIERPISKLYGIICSSLLNGFGYNSVSRDLNISDTKFSMSIATGCDAILPALFLCLIIIICPDGRISYKIKGISIGLFLLFFSNIIRLCSLFILGHYSKFWFDFFHIQFWQAYFILVSLAYFIYWLKNIKD